MATEQGSRFEKFSESARRALNLAQEESQRFNHNYVGTEHIILGLVAETEGTGVRVLSSLGVDLNKVRSAVEFIIGRGERPAQSEIGLTPRAKKVVELAVDEARRMNHVYIGTEHLLIGLLREGEGIVAGVLESLGVTLDNVRVATVRILREPEPPVSEVEAEPESASFVQELRALRQKLNAVKPHIEALLEELDTVLSQEDPQ